MNLEKLNWLLPDLLKFAVNVGVALLIFIVGFWLGYQLKNVIRKRMVRREVDPTIREFVLPIFDFLFKLLVIVTAIGALGIKVTSFAAILAGLAAGIGLSLQGSLSNFAGGLLIILFKPFKVGDYIEALSHSGTVNAISILYTTITTDHQQTVVLPNSSLLNNPIKNYSILPTRRMDIKIGVSYNEDLDKTILILRQMLEQEALVLKDKPITVEVLELTDYRINLAVRAFIKRENYWSVYFKMHKKTIEILRENNIVATPSPSKMIVSEKE
ncbi:MAG TPA: mechanosensitive ion channel domain-containing protein [Moheibacter sp.]|nr:mechanosensitive ion channel domain-containing protein [Moheibacter sp.]